MRPKSLRTRRQKPEAQTTEKILQHKYAQPFPISSAKKRDLVELCKKNVIDKDYHKWYEDLPVAADIVDKVPLPNTGDTSDTED